MTRLIWLVLLAGCLVVIEPDPEAAALGDSGLTVGEVHTCSIAVKQSKVVWTVCFAQFADLATYERETADACVDNGIDCDVRCSTHELWLCVIRCPGPPAFEDACNASYGCYCPPE